MVQHCLGTTLIKFNVSGSDIGTMHFIAENKQTAKNTLLFQLYLIFRRLSNNTSTHNFLTVCYVIILLLYKENVYNVRKMQFLENADYDYEHL